MGQDKKKFRKKSMCVKASGNKIPCHREIGDHNVPQRNVFVK